MKIKVCGLADPDNALSIAGLQPDLIGLIFFEGSPRCMVNAITGSYAKSIDADRVGVFVNEAIEKVKAKTEEYSLLYVQLHGDESAEYCRQLKSSGVGVIKAMTISSPDDFELTQNYIGVVDFFLFDAKGDNRGGNGVKFDWEVLKEYNGTTPYFLSGGIGPLDVSMLTSIEDSRLVGVDINSGFESRPGLKEVGLVEEFINAIRK